MYFGGTEKEILNRGTDWCFDLARLSAVILDCIGLTSRFVFVANPNKAYHGHVLLEVYYNNSWGIIDPLYGYVFYDTKPVNAKEILSYLQLQSLDDDYKNMFIQISIAEYNPNDIDNKYIITFTKKDGANFSQFPDSAICSINYTYRGAQQQQEFYFIKNVKGVNGESGKDGNGISRIEILYSRSNDGVRPPNNWYPSIEKIPEKDLILQFLWEKRIIYSTEKLEDGTYILSEEYSVQKDGLEIEKIVEYYALGVYINKTGVYVKEIKYNEGGKRASVILEDGQEKFIFYENGELRLNNNGDIIDKNSNLVFLSSEFELVSFARLYPEVVEWSDKVPMGNSEIVIGGQPKDTIVSPEKTGVFIVVSEQESSNTNNSLWLKYQMIYSNGSFGETDSVPIEEMNDLRLSAYKAETIYNDDSIQSIVGTREWKYSENGTVYEDFISYINQMPKEISMRISHDEFSTYFTLEEQGVIIGKTNSNFTTLTDDKGFNIQYHPYGYNSENESLSSTVVGSFNARGLNTPEITLINNLEAQTSKNIIILKGTKSGGFLWTKGIRGGDK